MSKVIVNFSGGVDSTVAIIKALDKFPKKDIVLCYQDTDADYIETLPHIQKISNILGIPLIILKNKEGFWNLSLRRGYFPTAKQRQCTAYLKRDIFNSWIRKNRHELGKDIIIVSGIRAEESLSRSKMPELSEHITTLKNGSFKADLWLPCLSYTKKEIKEIIQAEGLPIHPCYDFSERCSCWCCIFQPNSVVRTYAEMNPELYKNACIVEDTIKHKWKEHFGFKDLMKQGRMI